MYTLVRFYFFLIAMFVAYMLYKEFERQHQVEHRVRYLQDSLHWIQDEQIKQNQYITYILGDEEELFTLNDGRLRPFREGVSILEERDEQEEDGDEEDEDDEEESEGLDEIDTDDLEEEE